MHGTTVATNTLLERTGARVALCATAGATDLLALRRQERASLYDLARQHPASLVPPSDAWQCRSASSRRAWCARWTPPGAEAAARVARARSRTVVAVSLLHAYGDPAHERAMARRCRVWRRASMWCCSPTCCPEIREYERTATTVAEAYLRPGVAALRGAARRRG